MRRRTTPGAVQPAVSSSRPWPWARGIPAVATALVCAGTVGCREAEFGGLEVQRRSSPPVTVEVRDERVELPLGTAVRLKVKPVSKNRQAYTSNDDLRFESEDRSVLGVFQIDESSMVVLTGVRLGDTCLRVLVNERQVDCLPVEVVEQEP